MNFPSPRMRRALARSSVLVAILAVSLPSAPAQFQASLSGVVADPTGAVIPGATVTLRDLSTNRTLTATTNGSGGLTSSTNYHRITSN